MLKTYARSQSDFSKVWLVNMHLTTSGRFVGNGDTCRAFDLMPGKELQSYEGKIILYDIKKYEVSGSDRLLVDGCGELRVKVLDPAITLLTVADRHELDRVRPFLDSLRARKIIVVEPFEPMKNSAIKEELRKGRNHGDGSMMNNQLSAPDLLTILTSNLDKCNHDPSYAMDNYDIVDSTGKKRHIVLGCQLCHPPANYPPYLSDQSGNDVTGQMYRVIDDANNADHCRQALVLTHRDLPVTQVTLHTSGFDINTLQLNKIEDSLKEKQEAGLIDEEYYALRQEFLLIRHFAGLLQTFTRLREAYIALLNTHKERLLMEQQVKLAESVATSLLASPVIEEIKGVVSALVGLEKAQWQEDKQKQADESVRQNSQADNNRDESYDPQVKKSTTALLAELAEVYAVKHFRDVFLDNLVATGSLGCLLSEGYFKSRGRDKVLNKLIQKGSDLTATLADIAEKLECLTKPFLTKRHRSLAPGKELNMTFCFE